MRPHHKSVFAAPARHPLLKSWIVAWRTKPPALKHIGPSILIQSASGQAQNTFIQKTTYMMLPIRFGWARTFMR
jgi:hypothetical protein